MIIDKTYFLPLLDQLAAMDHTDKAVVQELRTFVETSPKLFRADGAPEHHMCAFFVPIVSAQRLIYVGHHIKANDWIPPGGHMEPGETTEETVRREFVEELQYTLTDEKIELFDVAIKDVSASGRMCKTHNDLWYLVHMKEPVAFTFDPGEFYDAAWMSYEDALARLKTDAFRPAMEHIRDLR